MPNSSCQLYLQANSGPSTLTLNGNIDGIGEIVTVSKNSVLMNYTFFTNQIMKIYNNFIIDNMNISFCPGKMSRSFF